MKKVIAMILSIIFVFLTASFSSYATNDSEITSNEISVVRKKADSDVEIIEKISKTEISEFLESPSPVLNYGTNINRASSFNNRYNPYSIIGTDEKTRVPSSSVYPYSAIGLIKVVWPDLHSVSGTAFLISNKVAVTAAHCIYDSSHGGWPLSVRFYPGKNGATSLNEPFGYAYAGEYAVSSFYRQANDQNESPSGRDWGLLGFSTDFGTRTGVLDYGCFSDDVLLNNTVEVVGYGDSVDFYQYKSQGNICYCTTDIFGHNLDTSNGMSGGPIFDATTKTVYGIQVSGAGTGTDYNLGLRLTGEMCIYFRQFIADYT